jgi:signal transduction histidine kinase
MADEQEPKDQAERGERAAERAVAVLQEANQILKEAQRLRAEAEAMMVHDFKQPLSVIIGFAETLQALGTEASTDELAEMVGIIHESGTRLLSLVTDFLDLARYEAGHVSLDLEQLDLASLVQPLVKQFAPQAVARQQKMEVNFPALPPVRADAKALTRVLSNLIENALKYTPEGSQVSLTGEYDGLFVRVVVRDNGPGVPPEDLPHLFESFYRGRGQSRASGTGLGLALSKHLIEAHGGRMGAANNESGGATFYFTLPSTD